MVKDEEEEKKGEKEEGKINKGTNLSAEEAQATAAAVAVEVSCRVVLYVFLLLP